MAKWKTSASLKMVWKRNEAGRKDRPLRQPQLIPGNFGTRTNLRQTGFKTTGAQTSYVHGPLSPTIFIRFYVAHMVCPMEENFVSNSEWIFDNKCQICFRIVAEISIKKKPVCKMLVKLTSLLARVTFQNIRLSSIKIGFQVPKPITHRKAQRPNNENLNFLFQKNVTYTLHSKGGCRTQHAHQIAKSGWPNSMINNNKK